MSQESRTSLNPDESPSFVTGVVSSETTRRQFDRHIMETIESDHKRVRDMSGRLIRIEQVFDKINADIARLENSQREGLGFQEQTATAMSEISNKLAVHTEMEEVQWGVVNESHRHLEQLSAALSQHLEAAGAINTRLDWIERLVFGVYGAAGSMIMLVGGWLLSKMG